MTSPAETERWSALVRLSESRARAVRSRQVQPRVTWAALERTTTPTLLVAGDADWYAPLPIVRQFAPRLKNRTVVILPEVGHSGFWEQPEAYNKSVLEFVLRY